MPCCAFAAFILSQIVLGLGTVKRFLLFRPAESEELATNPATEWRLGPASATVAAAKPRWTTRGLVLASSIELALVLGAAWGVHAHQHHHHHGAASLVASASRK